MLRLEEKKELDLQDELFLAETVKDSTVNHLIGQIGELNKVGGGCDRDPSHRPVRGHHYVPRAFSIPCPK